MDDLQARELVRGSSPARGGRGAPRPGGPREGDRAGGRAARPLRGGLARRWRRSRSPRRSQDDELVSHLLLLHGDPSRARSRRGCAPRSTRCAPTSTRTAANVELIAVEDGVVRLRMEGSCSGCPSSAVTLKLAIEDAIRKHAPDVTAIEAEDAAAGRRQLIARLALRSSSPPAVERTATRRRADAAGSLPQLRADGTVLEGGGRRAGAVPAGRRDVYAYRPDCPGCGHSLEDAELRGELLRCGPAAGATTSAPVTGGRPGPRAGDSAADDSLVLALKTTPAVKVAAAHVGSRLRSWPAPRTAEREAQEHCDLCSEPIPPEHRHLLDLETRELRCACRRAACCSTARAPAAGTTPGPRPAAAAGRLRARRRAWEELRIPVDMAFFFHRARGRARRRLLPGADGRDRVAARAARLGGDRGRQPRARGMEPDVEALLVNRARGARDSWLVPDRRLLRARRA